jgi:DNA-binding NarL/FixJ family response regulator
MSEMTGIEVLKEIRNRNLDIKTIFFTNRSDEASFDEAMNLGINGYILKDCAICDVLGCIRNVADGQYCITPALSNTLLLRRNKIKNLENKFSFLDKLTKSEKSILYLLAEGKTSKQIGEELFISHKTVDNHKSNISEKLGLKGLHCLMKFAIENKEARFKVN